MTKKWIFGIALLLIGYGCKKDESPPDLSYLCDTGGLWLVNKVDSFNPNSGLDTFYFSQAGGYHRFVFTNSFVNRLQIDVKSKPDSGQTTIYRSLFVREISGSYIAEPFIYTNMKDSMLTITNNGNHYLVSIKPFTVKTSTSKSIEVRACNLKMTDVTP